MPNIQFSGKEHLDSLSFNDFVFRTCRVMPSEHSIADLVRKAYEVNAGYDSGIRSIGGSQRSYDISKRFSYIIERIMDHYGLTENEKLLLYGLQKKKRIISKRLIDELMQDRDEGGRPEFSFEYLERYYAIKCKGKSLDNIIKHAKKALDTLEVYYQGGRRRPESVYNDLEIYPGLMQSLKGSEYKTDVLDRHIESLKPLIKQLSSFKLDFDKEQINKQLF